MGHARRGDVEADAGHGDLELLAILGGGDGVGLRADQLDAVLVEHPELDQLHGEVEGRLAAEGRQEGVGSFAFDDAGEDLGGERLDVGGVCEVGVGHDRRGVRVGQHDGVALVAQDPTRLRARVVELAGLPDHDRAGPDQQDLVDVVATRHQPAPPRVSGVVVAVVVVIMGPFRSRP